jgi:hypothetical protein
MQYMLLIYGDEKARPSDLPPEAMQQEMQAWFQYSDWLREQGWMVAGDALHDTDHATTVRVRGGETLTTDGPFAETKEQLGGYYLLECEDLDQALEAAARCPGALYGSIEVRPIEVFDAPEGG